MAAEKITKSNSLAVALILLVKKLDGSFQLYVYYHTLNKVTVKNRDSVPLITKLCKRLHKAKIFIKLDLKNGYHLVRMLEEDEENTVFFTRF